MIPNNIKIKDKKKNIDYSIDRKLIDFIEWFSSQHGSHWVGLKMVGMPDKFIKKDDIEIKNKEKISIKSRANNSSKVS